MLSLTPADHSRPAGVTSRPHRTIPGQAPDAFCPFTPMKTILIGAKKKALHKEELNTS